MIKKKYLTILSLAIVSVLLGSLLYNHLVLAGKPVSDVNVVNFPLDEEGNLRVTEMDGERNVNVTNWLSSLNINVTNLPLDEQGNLRISIQDNNGTLETYKDVVEIDVFGWATRMHTHAGEPNEWGVYVHPSFPAPVAFAFSPKQTFLNITDIIIVVYATEYIDDFTLSIYGIAVYYAREFRFDSVSPTTRLIHIDHNLVEVNEGLNTLAMSGLSGGLHVYKLSLFIEYEYQA